MINLFNKIKNQLKKKKVLVFFFINLSAWLLLIILNQKYEVSHIYYFYLTLFTVVCFMIFFFDKKTWVVFLSLVLFLITLFTLHQVNFFDPIIREYYWFKNEITPYVEENRSNQSYFFYAIDIFVSLVLLLLLYRTWEDEEINPNSKNTKEFFRKLLKKIIGFKKKPSDIINYIKEKIFKPKKK